MCDDYLFLLRNEFDKYKVELRKIHKRKPLHKRKIKFLSNIFISFHHIGIGVYLTYLPDSYVKIFTFKIHILFLTIQCIWDIHMQERK